jgi:hypothetical protein
MNNKDHNPLANVRKQVVKYHSQRGTPDARDTFLNEICNTVTPEMLRGGVNRDAYGRNSLIHTDVVCLALVFKGMKPMCLITEVPDFIDELMTVGELASREVVNEFERRKQWVIFPQRAEADALKLVAHREAWRPGKWRPHDSFVEGHYLGYPFDDIVYFYESRYGVDGIPHDISDMPELVDV